MIRFIKMLQQFSYNRVGEFGAQDTLFAIFSLVFFMMPYYGLFDSDAASHNLVFGFRAAAGILSFLLIMKPIWPQKALLYYPLFWHFSLLFCLPFFSTFLLIKEVLPMSSFFLTIFLLAILVDWLSFILLVILGALCAFALYFYLEGFGGSQSWNPNKGFVLAQYTLVVLLGAIFNRNKEKATQDKFSAMKTIGAAIAHEMRTPLASINISSTVLKQHLPKFIDGYIKAKEHGLEVENMSEIQIHTTQAVPQRLSQVCKSSLMTIDMLLMLGSKPKESVSSQCDTLECVRTALSEYAFFPRERRCVVLRGNVNFRFNGSGDLMVHILFNLLKNSLHYIRDKKRGEIEIWCEQKDNHNSLHFKDTAIGISENDLPHIFESSFSKRKHGTGLGLNFCKKAMESMGGKIKCFSQVGEHTEFILTFPKIEENENA